MITFLLPPSETKAAGGPDPALNLDTLAFSALTRRRQTLLKHVKTASGKRDAAKQFKLGPKQAELLTHNLVLETAGTMPAIHRYTGVLFDEISVQPSDSAAWSWLDKHVVIHSALFGPVNATDQIPNYRYSADSRIGDIRNKAHWASAVQGLLAALPYPIVDLRSKSYVALGPVIPVSVSQGSKGKDPTQVRNVPPTHERVFLEIHHQDSTGTIRPLNHFNKKAKGELMNNLIHSQPEFSQLTDFWDWLSDNNVTIKKIDETLWLMITR